MADERIDVEITDKIAPSIDKKLVAIDRSALKASGSVALLKKELASIQGGSLSTLNKAVSENANATLRQASGNAKVAESAATATRAIDKEAAAQARLSAVIDRTIARQEAATAANAAASGRLGGATGSRSLAAAQTALMAGTGAGVSAETKQVERAVAQMESTTTPLFQRFKNGALNAFDAVRDAVTKNGTRFTGLLGAGGEAKLASEAAALTKTGHAAKGTSVVTRELFTIAREAGRGDFTRLAGSATILGSALGLMNSVMIPAAIILGTLAAAMKVFQLSISGDADPKLKAYANTLGLTHKEMRKLGDETVSAKGKLESFNTVHLTFGDVFHGLIKTIQDTFNLSPTLTKLKNDVLEAMTTIAKNTMREVAQIYGFFYAAYKNIGKVWSNLPALLGSLVVATANAVISTIESMVNGGIGAINKLAHGANVVLDKVGLHIGDIGTVSLPRIKDAWGKTTKDIGDGIAGDYQEGFNKATGAMRGFMSDWKKNSIQAGKDRLKAMADAIKGNRNPTKPKVDHTAENRAKALADVNRQLDSELALMGKYGPQAEIQKRYDEILNGLAEKKITLNDAEKKSIHDKVAEIVRLGGVQEQLTRIYSALVQPTQTYNNTVEAANKLLRDGTITQQQYNREKANAARTLAEVNDPFLKLNEAHADELALVGKYGRELAIATEVQQRYNELKAIDASITTNALPGIEAEVRALQAKRDLQSQFNAEEGNIMSAAAATQQNEFLITNYQALYDRINQLRQQDVLSEQGAMAAKADLSDRYRRARLTNESALLGQLATLQDSGNKKLAAIGKAAAMTQATIDGVLAVQKALASYPPPLNFVMAALVGATAAMNVAKIAGFESGGYTGNGGRKEMAGVVHGKEFVMNADATARNRPLLDALNRGADATAAFARAGTVQQPSTREPGAAAPASATGGQPGTPGQAAVADRFKIVNVLDPREALAALDTYEGEQLIVNVIERRRNEISGMMGGR